MHGIETSISFTYSTTLQFYDPHAVSGSAGSATKVGKKVKEWLSAITLRNPNIVIQTNSGKVLKLTKYPDTKAVAFDLLQYETFKQNRRNVSVLFSITTNSRFHELANPSPNSSRQHRRRLFQCIQHLPRIQPPHNTNG
jgi:hypothetical protein